MPERLSLSAPKVPDKGASLSSSEISRVVPSDHRASVDNKSRKFRRTLVALPLVFGALTVGAVPAAAEVRFSSVAVASSNEVGPPKSPEPCKDSKWAEVDAIRKAAEAGAKKSLQKQVPSTGIVPEFQNAREIYDNIVSKNLSLDDLSIEARTARVILARLTEEGAYGLASKGNSFSSWESKTARKILDNYAPITFRYSPQNLLDREYGKGLTDNVAVARNSADMEIKLLGDKPAVDRKNNIEGVLLWADSAKMEDSDRDYKMGQARACAEYIGIEPDNMPSYPSAKEDPTRVKARKLIDLKDARAAVVHAMNGVDFQQGEELQDGLPANLKTRATEGGDYGQAYSLFNLIADKKKLTEERDGHNIYEIRDLIQNPAVKTWVTKEVNIMRTLYRTGEKRAMLDEANRVQALTYGKAIGIFNSLVQEQDAITGDLKVQADLK